LEQISNLAGRAGMPPAMNFQHHSKKLGLELGRLKTGTPPRLLRDPLTFQKLEISR